MTYTIIQIEDQFSLLRNDSLCAYGRFATRAEAEEAIAESETASKAHGYDPIHY